MQDRRLVIFDCDGVLVDSEPISNRVLAEALTAEGLPTTLQYALAEYKGLLLSEIVTRVETRLGRSLSAGWGERFESDRAEAFRQELAPVPGAAEAVRGAISAGWEICVASQGRLEKTRLTLSLTGLRPLFSDRTLFSAWCVPRGKPHPDLFLHAARTMGCDPARCVVVEDTPSGVSAAVAAGMPALGYAPTEDDAHPLQRVGARVFSSLGELPALLENA